ncbi:MAG: DNA polymerase I [Bdellovibrionota bacterium]
MPQQKTLYLIDVSSFIYRAFFAIRRLHSRKGEPTNAVYGVANMLSRLWDEAKPQYAAVVFDSREPSFRKQEYHAYKANRSSPPEDLIPQFSRIEQLVAGLEIPSFRKSGFEADDLIATLALKWRDAAPENQVVVVSGDKDLMQIVGERITMWDTMTDKHYGPREVNEKLGVEPGQVRDYLALVGDSSDNIPGVSGIGPKSAVELLKEFGNLENILSAARDGSVSGKKCDLLLKHAAEAEISKKLATVLVDIPVEVGPELLHYEFHMTQECINLLRELDFGSLLERWAKKPGDPPAMAGTRVSVAAAEHFKCVKTEQDLNSLLESLEKAKKFGFDIETTSLNPREAELVGISFCYDPSCAFYIPVGHRDTSVRQLPRELVSDKLRLFIEDASFKKIGQNLKYDWSVLINRGFNPQGIGADTMVAAYILNSEGHLSLKALAERYLDYNVLTYEEVCGKGKEQIRFDDVPVELATRYSAEDAWVAMELWRKLEPMLEAERLMGVFSDIDIPMVGVLARMEQNGVCIDVDWLKGLSLEFEQDLHVIDDKIRAFTRGPVNLNSPKQLAVLLFEELGLPTQSKTKTGYSTDAQVLEVLAPMHEVPRLLLEYREISKLKGTYIDPLPGLRDIKTGKIHASFHQTVTATGRLSSSDPNLQNIPIRTERGKKIRRAFIPSSGNVLVAADYSQIELRLLAHMSGDVELVRSFRTNEDVHSRTAGEIFGVSPSDVTEQQRGVAKAINFGLMYGKTPFGLAQELKISRTEARAMIDRYFARYSGVKAFLDKAVEEARGRGWVSTLSGRKRHLPDIRSNNQAVRAFAERVAMNAPIQGTAADLMKLAMIEIDRKLESGGFKAKLIVQVHDEVVLDCPREESEDVLKLITSVMENVMPLSVPLKVNAATGDNWMEV